MTWKDKLEIGLKEDAPYRRDNLPEREQHGHEHPAGPDRSPVVEEAEIRAHAHHKRLATMQRKTRRKSHASRPSSRSPRSS